MGHRDRDARPPSASLLIGNVLRVRPAATPEEACRIAPMLAELSPADLRERMTQARRRLGLDDQGRRLAPKP
ncbi:MULTISPECIES: hypothetical protein [Brevundimonas]|jgi:hypothetical protein|uniref:hypothetical protein n=1 Tax=Brevundimonas TaxID=41275 RepID=UPI0015B79591|nr:MULTISPECIES: hypothetical protein [Brevundimonas]MBD3832023.1 hypothetical protein [Brevundimonas sp.]MBK1970054.1 hypothetical protein [Brevundimonas diminuta]NWE51528.1 hypothetical protein [Brevundimonas sp. P7753]